MPSSAINSVLHIVTINGTPVTIKVISDDQPEMEKVYKLWYEVYMRDLKYNLKEGVSHQENTATQPPNGSVLYIALTDGICVGSLRTTYQCNSQLECDYASWLPNNKLGELSKLIVNKRFRNTKLSGHLLVACFDYTRSSGNWKLFDLIVMSCPRKLLPYYYLFGFTNITHAPTIHPHTGNQTYYLQCTCETNIRVVNELRQVLKGNKLMEAKWTIKYWWYKSGIN